MRVRCPQCGWFVSLGHACEPLPPTKRCPACAETKDRSEFGTNRYRRGGINAYCLVCNRKKSRMRAAQERSRRRAAGPPPLPAGPLLAFADALLVEVSDPSLTRAIERARAAGAVPFWTADRLAVALGTHPALIWPEFFFDAEPLGGAA